MAVVCLQVLALLLLCFHTILSAETKKPDVRLNGIAKDSTLYFHAGDPAIKKVHVVFMNHLDVGYDGVSPTGFINNVLNVYFHQHIPQAITLGQQLRVGGYTEGFIYTTHPWLVSMFLDCPPNFWLAGVQLMCPNAEALANFTKAVQVGDITWQAGPMNMQIENMDDSLMQFGLKIGKDLDARFNITRKFRVLSQRDVPGLTQAAIPSLVKMGVTGVSVGVNPTTSPPAVPSGTFVWRYGNSEVLATWHKGGYPDNPGPDPAHPGGISRSDCAIVPGFAEILCFGFRSDNTGPPQSVQEVLGYYEILRAEFPGAELVASKFEDYFEAIQPIKSKLPVITNEISDTWIQGIASDPRKMAEYRAVARTLKSCLASGECVQDDPKVYNASRFLVKLPEHTWGLPSVGDNLNWTNSQFYRAKKKKVPTATLR